MGKMFFNIPATFAEVDLLRTRTREGMAVAKAKGRLRGSPRQHRELGRGHATVDYPVDALAGLFTVSRPTVSRALERDRAGP